MEAGPQQQQQQEQEQEQKLIHTMRGLGKKDYSKNQKMYNIMVDLIIQKVQWMITKQKESAQKGSDINSINGKKFGNRDTALQQVLSYLAERRYMIFHIQRLMDNTEIFNAFFKNISINLITDGADIDNVSDSIEICDKTYTERICRGRERKNAQIKYNTENLQNKTNTLYEKFINKLKIGITDLYDLYAYTFVIDIIGYKEVYNYDPEKSWTDTIPHFYGGLGFYNREHDGVSYGVVRSNSIDYYGLPYTFYQKRKSDDLPRKRNSGECEQGLTTTVVHGYKNIKKKWNSDKNKQTKYLTEDYTDDIEFENLSFIPNDNFSGYIFDICDKINTFKKEKKEKLETIDKSKISNLIKFRSNEINLTITEGDFECDYDLIKYRGLLYHIYSTELPKVCKKLENIYNNIIHSQEVDLNLGRLYWWLSQGTLFVRGSFAITEYLNKALRLSFGKEIGKVKRKTTKISSDVLKCLEKHGIKQNEFKMKNTFPDIEAMIYNENCKYIIEKDIEYDMYDMIIEPDIDHFSINKYPTMWNNTYKTQRKTSNNIQKQMQQQIKKIKILERKQQQQQQRKQLIRRKHQLIRREPNILRKYLIKNNIEVLKDYIRDMNNIEYYLKNPYLIPTEQFPAEFYGIANSENGLYQADIDRRILKLKNNAKKLKQKNNAKKIINLFEESGLANIKSKINSLQST